MDDIELGIKIGNIEESTKQTAEDVSELKVDVKDLREHVTNLEMQYLSKWAKLPLRSRRAIIGVGVTTITGITIGIIDHLTDIFTNWLSGLFG